MSVFDRCVCVCMCVCVCVCVRARDNLCIYCIWAVGLANVALEKIALSNEGCHEGTQVELHTLSCKL